MYRIKNKKSNKQKTGSNQTNKRKQNGRKLSLNTGSFMKVFDPKFQINEKFGDCTPSNGV